MSLAHDSQHVPRRFEPCCNQGPETCRCLPPFGTVVPTILIQGCRSSSRTVGRSPWCLLSVRVMKSRAPSEMPEGRSTWRHGQVGEGGRSDEARSPVATLLPGCPCRWPVRNAKSKPVTSIVPVPSPGACLVEQSVAHLGTKPTAPCLLLRFNRQFRLQFCLPAPTHLAVHDRHGSALHVFAPERGLAHQQLVGQHADRPNIC